jgi:diguanylate cyclase (GGDEF)-like protein/PAS domain S-box-containing protein
MRPKDLFPLDRAALWPPFFERALNEGFFKVEYVLLDGQVLELTFNPIVFDGIAAGISVFGKNISERKKVEHALNEAERKYQDIFDGALEGVFQNTLEGQVLTVNPALARILGYESPEQVLCLIKNAGQDVWVNPDERLSYLKELKDHGEVLGYGCRFKRKDGSIIWVSVNGRIVRGADGEALYLNGFLIDITRDKRAQEALRESTDFLKQAQENGDFGFYALDIPAGVWTSSDKLDDLFGIDKEYERTIAGWLALIHPDDRAMMAIHANEEVFGEGKAFDKEYRIIRRTDQAERWVQGMGRLEFDAQGQPLKMRGIIRDITNRKRAEIQLHDSEERYRATFEQAAVGILHTSLDGHILRCNQRFADMIAYRVDEIAGMRFQQITAPEDLAKSNRALQCMTAYAGIGTGPSVWEKRYVRKDGSLTWVKLTISIQRDDGGRALHYITVVEDINERKAAEERLAATQEALRVSEERYRTTFQMSIDAVAINRLSDGLYIDVNKAFLDVTGYERQEVLGRSSLELGIWADPNDRLRIIEELRVNSIGHNLEVQFRKKNGTVVWGLISVSVIQITGEPCILSVSRDISDSKAAEMRLAKAQEALRSSEERYRTTFQMSIDAININRFSDGVFVDANEAFLSFVGCQREEVIGRTSQDLNFWVDSRDRQRMLDILRLHSRCRDLVAQFRTKNGELVWGQMSGSLIDVDGIPCILSVTRDISNTKAAEDEIRHLAFYDPLTGLPNRRLLLERLRQSLSASSRTKRKRALLFVDLDNFKNLNDTLGHQTGDLLLQEVASRLATCIRKADTVARLGGDEFVVMLEDLSDIPEEAAGEAEAVSEKILAAIDQPYWLSGRECFSTSSIGITVFGDKRESTNEVLQQADIAMYQAKTAGRNTMRFFAPALQAAVNARAAMEEDLRHAIKTSQFVLYYQPQVDCTRLIGAEALVRWNHPKRGLLAPGEFIHLAEETGLILPLGEWVLETACTQIAAWASQVETAHLSVSVNISARQFRQPDFVEQVLAALDRTGANPKNLKLELTESMLVDNIEDVIAKMTEFKSHGLGFSLDDFGTGYSSLAYLKRLPLDQLKIDRSFVRDILEDVGSRAIAQSVISLGRALSLSVIAEGVETEEQLGYLTRLGCHTFQGFLFSRPLPLQEFEGSWLDPGRRGQRSSTVCADDCPRYVVPLMSEVAAETCDTPSIACQPLELWQKYC